MTYLFSIAFFTTLEEMQRKVKALKVALCLNIKIDQMEYLQPRYNLPFKTHWSRQVYSRTL